VHHVGSFIWSIHTYIHTHIHTYIHIYKLMDERNVSVDKLRKFESVQNVEVAVVDCASIFQQGKGILEFCTFASFIMYLIYTSAIETEHSREITAGRNQSMFLLLT